MCGFNLLYTEYGYELYEWKWFNQSIKPYNKQVVIIVLAPAAGLQP